MTHAPFGDLCSVHWYLLADVSEQSVPSSRTKPAVTGLVPDELRCFETGPARHIVTLQQARILRQEKAEEHSTARAMA